MSTVLDDQLSDLFKFCNQIRKAGGGDELVKLEPGVQSQPKSCLIAKNLNFDCSVVPYDDLRTTINWFMVVEDKSTADKLTSFLGKYDEQYIGTSIHRYKFSLPEWVGELARKFDSRQLPSELYIGIEKP